MDASPVLLEPIMHVEVYVPDEYLGDVMGDMNKRRGRIMGMNQVDGMQQLVAEDVYKRQVKSRTCLFMVTPPQMRIPNKIIRYTHNTSKAAFCQSFFLSVPMHTPGSYTHLGS